MFAQAMFDHKVQEEQKYYENDSRWTKGKVDYPFSLMEGSAGAICLLSDLLKGDVKFPGFEI